MSEYTTMNTQHTTLEHSAESRVGLSISKLTEIYVETLSPKEKKAYLIARDHLGMSFTLEKSVGFLQWKKTFLG